MGHGINNSIFKLSDGLGKGAPLLILLVFYYGVVFASTHAKCNISVILGTEAMAKQVKVLVTQPSKLSLIP